MSVMCIVDSDIYEKQRENAIIFFDLKSSYCIINIEEREKDVMALNKKRKLQAMRNGRFDKGITIKRLVARQGLECCYCHELCDWNDYEFKGQKQPCDKFPTIEHLIPIACGRYLCMGVFQDGDNQTGKQQRNTKCFGLDQIHYKRTKQVKLLL